MFTLQTRLQKTNYSDVSFLAYMLPYVVRLTLTDPVFFHETARAACITIFRDSPPALRIQAERWLYLLLISSFSVLFVLHFPSSGRHICDKATV